MIAVVDYHKGNLKSVQRGLEAVGAQVVITDNPDVIASADGIVLPGVGAFADAAATMEQLGQMQVIKDRIEKGVPFLGICLGLHLMFERGFEHNALDRDSAAAEGLGILSGDISHMPVLDELGKAYKIPHVGWNSLVFEEESDCVLIRGIEPGEYFYFTHSYAAPLGTYDKATTSHSITFPSIVQFGDVAFGVQFHPEKSSDAGLHLLKNFVSLVEKEDR